MENLTERVRELCRENGGSWKGFRLGDEDALLVHMRRTARKYYLLRVVDVLEEDKDYGCIEVDDPKYGREEGVARRYNNQSFVLAEYPFNIYISDIDK